jgi:hypothetical protein
MMVVGERKCSALLNPSREPFLTAHSPTNCGQVGTDASPGCIRWSPLSLKVSQ